MSGSRSGTIKLVSIADLDTLLNPESLVVIGASAREGSPGLTLASNLNREDFSGQVHLVNPRYDEVLGRTCLKSVKDLLLADDYRTRAIIVYLDRVNGTRAFLSALSAVARRKPVVLMKSTHDSAAYCDALTRNGREFTSDDTFQGALDKALAHTGDERSMQRLLSRGSNRWSGTNPVVLRDAEHGPEQFKASLNVLGHTRGFDAVLVIFTPDARSNTADVARAVIAAKPPKIPMIACWMGESQVHEARELFAEAGIPCFRTPEAAADAFDFLNRYHRSQQQLLQLPAPTARDTRIDIDRARSLVQIALESGERVLGPQRTRLLLTNLDIDVMPAIRATTSIEAISAASRIGYPVVVKLVSPNIAWKAPIIHTALNVEDDTDVQEAFSAARNALHTKRPDAEFRGVLIERQHTAQGKRVVQLPPLNPYLIEEMLNESPLADYLGSFRHHDALDTAPLVAVLRRVSEIACELPDVFSLDINPLIVSDEGAVAIDVHVVLERARQLPGEHKRYGHLSIHPWLTLNIEGLQVAGIRHRDASLDNDVRMLCLHGWLDNAASFLPLMPYLPAIDMVTSPVTHWEGALRPSSR